MIRTRLGFLYILTVLFIGCQQNDRPKAATPSDERTPRFKAVTPEFSGISFTNTVVERHQNLFNRFQYVYNGAGVAVGDIDNDGLADIYFTANETPNKLYRNKGDLRFEDITEKAGVGGNAQWTNGVTMVDINADGLLDIYVCKGGWQNSPDERKNELYINQGDATFREESVKYGLADSGYSMHATFFDVDNDNDLDMYLINRPATFDLSVADYQKGANDPPEDARDKLFINTRGNFSEEGAARGITKNYGHSLAVVASDMNNDGYTDIYVTNDFEAKDLMYLNQGDGTFKERIEESTNHISYSSMGADIADIDNDGLEDIITMEMQSEDYVRSKVSMPPMNVPRFEAMQKAGMHRQYMHNTLLRNRGNGFFSDIAQYAGMDKTDWSWAVLASDLDNDGLRDLMITNGLRRDITDRDGEQRIKDHVPSMKKRYSSPQEAMTKGISEIIALLPEVKLKNYLFQNEGDLSYADVSDDWGFSRTSFSNGAAVADFDNDGDLDLIINNLEDQAFLFENTSDSKNNYIRFRLEGPPGNTHGLDAKIKLYQGKNIQYFQNKTVRGYLSSSEPEVHFGLGAAIEVDSAVILWPDGKKSLLKDLEANKEHVISYKKTARDKILVAEQKKTIFADVSQSLLSTPFKHRENEWDEYKEQVLLPHSFSKNGPSVAVGDVDADGLEDFYVGGASGQSGKLYLQRDGTFDPRPIPLFEKDARFEDTDAHFADMDGDGSLDMIVASGGSEHPEGSALYRTRIYYNSGTGQFTERDFLSATHSSSSLAIYDIDSDGDLDIFVGGEVVANAYGVSPASHLFRNEGGSFFDRTSQIAPSLSSIGMVRAAIWEDLVDDSQKELVLVGEWMPVTVFSMEKGKLKNVSKKLGLENTNGWWNTVRAADLDDDGDRDLILGNLGKNYKFEATAEKPFELYADDFDGNGTHDIFLTKNYKGRQVPIRGKDCSSQQLPQLKNKYRSFKAFADADIEDIIGQNLQQALHLKSYQFSSLVLVNGPDGLTPIELSTEAQLSTVNGIEVLDFDDDGIKDLLVAGNRFDVEIETTPADASIGCLLKGKGNFEYDYVPLKESGVFLPYNVKDVEAIEVNGNIHILVAVNDNYLKILGRQRSESE